MESGPARSAILSGGGPAEPLRKREEGEVVSTPES
jgi:hypothetical protein